MFVNNEATVTSRVGGVMHILSSCILSPYIRLVSSYSEQFFYQWQCECSSLLTVDNEF